MRRVKPRVFVTYPFTRQELARLYQFTPHVRVRRSDRPATAEEILRGARDADGILAFLLDRIGEEVYAACPGVRVVSYVGAGMDRVDLAAARRHRVTITNSPDALTETTADLTFGLVIAAARRFGEGERLLRAGGFHRWGFRMMWGMDVHHRTIGIIGAGRIGSAVARRARGFGMNVIYASRSRKPDLDRETGARKVPLDRLLRDSDFVCVTCPLTPETHHLIGARELALMKRTAVLVNTARGPVVDEKALARMLRARRIFAAGLDVYEREPQVEPGLLRLPNVVLLPHIGSATAESRQGMVDQAIVNLVAALSGRRPPNRVV